MTGQSRLVSIDEFNDGLILFPLSKTIQYDKAFRIIVEDLPHLDHRLVEYIEQKFPRRFQSICSLLKQLGIVDKIKVKDLYRLHIRPTLLDSNRWSIKSDSVLLAFLMCVYVHFDQLENDFGKEILVKTRDGKFVHLDSPDPIIHLTSTYGCIHSLESFSSTKYQFTFISDDYFNEYHQELFSTKDQMRKFVTFLDRLNINEFIQMNNTDTRKTVPIFFSFF